jgi:heme/copper-type cytochrome/quinol oxidase subunit 2
METSVAAPRTHTRRPLAALGKLTVGALIALGLSLVYMQIAIIGQLIPPLTVLAVICAIIAGVITIGWRWAPALGTLISAVIISGNMEHIQYNFSHPESTHQFAVTLFLVVVAIVGIVAGISTVTQNYRSAERRTPRALPFALTALVGLYLGAILVAAIPQGGAGVDDATLAALPGLATANFAFSQQEIRAKVGEVVALRLENSDREGHSFDIDALNVHVAMPSGQPSLAVFTPAQPGTYSFYCGVPGHESAMTGTLVVEP